MTTPGEERKSMQPRPSRKSKYAEDTSKTPGGITDLERQLLMIDDDRDEVMNMIDSDKMGMYIVKEKAGYQPEEMATRMRQNLEAKKAMRDKMLRVNAKQNLGEIEGEDPRMQSMIKQEAARPITFKQGQKLDPNDVSRSEEAAEESLDFQRADEHRRKVKFAKDNDLIEQMDRLYGPEKDRVKASTSKKTKEKVDKLEQKKHVANHGGTAQEKGITREKEKRRTERAREAALMGGQDFDFVRDYLSSDYEYVGAEEIDHLNKY
jgi:hypothetical protein